MSILKEKPKLTLTEKAINKINSLITAEKKSSLRLSVTGGGCAGYQYKFTIQDFDDFDEEDFIDDDFEDDDDDGDEEVGDSDFAITDDTGKTLLLIDNKSSKLVNGSTIDYVEKLDKSGFIVSNPIAKTKCGCGSSFSV